MCSSYSRKVWACWRLATPLRSPSPTFIGEDCPVNPDLSSGLSAGERTAPLTSLEHHACLLHIAGPGTLFMRFPPNLRCERKAGSTFMTVSSSVSSGQSPDSGERRVVASLRH